MTGLAGWQSSCAGSLSHHSSSLESGSLLLKWEHFGAGSGHAPGAGGLRSASRLCGRGTESYPKGLTAPLMSAWGAFGCQLQVPQGSVLNQGHHRVCHTQPQCLCRHLFPRLLAWTYGNRAERLIDESHEVTTSISLSE